MFQVGDRVVYGIHGVCRVADQEQRKVDRQMVTYLVLEPVGQEGSQFLVPAHNEKAMSKLRPILTKEELEAMLRDPRILQDCWISDENRRKQTYRDLISSGEREKLAQMVHTLYRHKRQLAEAGKRCHLCDDNFLRDAERLLINEAALVLETDPDQAKAYIREKLKEDA